MNLAQSIRDQDAAPPTTEQPVIGYVVGAICIAAMIVITIINWDQMPERIITRQADATHTEAAPHRAFSAAVAPITLAVILVLMSLAPKWNSFIERSVLRTGASARARRGALDAVLCALSLLLLAVHVGVMSLYTGGGPDLYRAAAIGLALVGVGVAAALYFQGRGTPGSAGRVRFVGLALGAASLVAGALIPLSPMVSLFVSACALVAAAVASSVVQAVGRFSDR